jgi:hypothetical protein
MSANKNQQEPLFLKMQNEDFVVEFGSQFPCVPKIM